MLQNCTEQRSDRVHSGAFADPEASRRPSQGLRGKNTDGEIRLIALVYSGSVLEVDEPGAILLCSDSRQGHTTHSFGIL